MLTNFRTALAQNLPMHTRCCWCAAVNRFPAETLFRCACSTLFHVVCSIHWYTAVNEVSILKMKTRFPYEPEHRPALLLLNVFFFLQVLLARHSAQKLLLPLQSLRPTTGKLEDPPQHRTSLGCRLQVLGPRRPPRLRRQARSPRSPTTT